MSENCSDKFANADLTYVINGIMDSGDAANSAGKFNARKMPKLIDLIFRAIYTRKNKLGYLVKTEKRNDPESVAPNKDMAETPETPEKEPEIIGETKVDAPEKEPEKEPKKKTPKK